jgi:short subunit dehydrogenase-like uncharacterized protein
VHACGYDSIPSDLAVLLLHERAAADAARAGCGDVRSSRPPAAGSAAGRVDSMRGQVDAMRRDPVRAPAGADPFALSPDRAAEPDGPQPPDAGQPHPDPGRPLDAPFVMGGVQHPDRAAQQRLQGYAYGREAAVRGGDGQAGAGRSGRWLRPR